MAALDDVPLSGFANLGRQERETNVISKVDWRHDSLPDRDCDYPRRQRDAAAGPAIVAQLIRIHRADAEIPMHP
jgi:hypothetical protein